MTSYALTLAEWVTINELVDGGLSLEEAMKKVLTERPR